MTVDLCVIAINIQLCRQSSLFVSTLHSVSHNYRQADVVILLVVLSCLLTCFAVGGYYVNISLIHTKA